jgi:two-component system chemotaxis response regulator CheY
MNATTRANILVVDDANTVRMYHRKVLGDAGWQVDEAINGVEALEKALNRPAAEGYDLYVVDVNMPKMDGFTFVRELRRQAQVRQAPVLMVSTEAQPQDAAAALEAGANGYLVKPPRPSELMLVAALMLGDLAVACHAAACEAAHASRGVRT